MGVMAGAQSAAQPENALLNVGASVAPAPGCRAARSKTQRRQDDSADSGESDSTVAAGRYT